MSIDGRPYSVFISYARRDDVNGLITTMVDILRDVMKATGDDHRVFFDRSELSSFDLWKTNLRRGLRQSQVLVVFVSRAYFRSDPCRWEWMEHEAKYTAPDFPVAVVPVLLEDVADDMPSDELHQSWHAHILQLRPGLDLRELAHLSPAAITSDKLSGHVRMLGSEIHEHLSAVRRWENSATNLSQGTTRFAGRQDELARLDEALTSTGSIGIVTTIAGIRGIGKTELVRQYAHRHRAAYPADIWQLAAEHHTQMLPLLASLATDLPGLTIPDDIRTNPSKIGKRVRDELARRAADGAGLLILDNVADPALLSPTQLDELPTGQQLHVVATTRLGQSDFLGNPHVAPLPIDGVSHAESVELIRLHQPTVTADGEPTFRTPDDEAAAHELAILLRGFTLAVELAAAYLATRPEVTVRQLLDYLASQGVTALDTMVSPDVAASVHHQDKTIGLSFNDQETP